jgi:pyruvate ferredoxin oxidoreductase alpha subunit
MMNQSLLGMNGDEAVAYAIKQVNPDVVSAYPITPQTIIVERFSEYVADAKVDTEFILVESEHSALSSCIGAAASGARTFTATAANGLAYMWEIVYIAPALRMPIIMAVANRALSGPINIHCDHSDSMGARDSGWIQIYCENSQEVYDACIESWRIGEHSDVQLPVMICLDGFTLSHTMENVLTLSDDVIQDFVGERSFIDVKTHLGEVELRLDPMNPLTMGPASLMDYYFEHKLQHIEALDSALNVIPGIDEVYSQYSGRRYGLLESYRMEDAEIALIGLGSTMGTVRYVVNNLRALGVKAGLIKMRVFRPFPAEALIEAVGSTPVIGVLDKSTCLGGPGGPVYEDVKTVFYDKDPRPLIVDYVYGIGGRDTSPKMVENIFKKLMDVHSKGFVQKAVDYIGVRS